MSAPAAAELVADHAELAVLLGSFEKALGARDVRRAHDLLDLFWARLAVHIRAEHLRMFEALRAIPSEKLTGKCGLPTAEEVDLALEQLRVDHDVFMVELAEAMKGLRNLITKPHYVDSAGIFSDAERRIAIVKGRLDQHNAFEEMQVYRWLDRLLEPAEVEAVREGMHEELANLPPRLK